MIGAIRINTADIRRKITRFIPNESDEITE